MEFKVNIDKEFLDQAEKEINKILLQQHHSYSDRLVCESLCYQNDADTPIYWCYWQSAWTWAQFIYSLDSTSMVAPAWVNIEVLRSNIFIIINFLLFLFRFVHVRIRDWNKKLCL